MAKLPKNITCPQMNSLAGRFGGVLDFYFWKGIPCVRVWPKYDPSKMTAEQIASFNAFAAIAQLKSQTPPMLREELAELCSDSTYTWADLYTSWGMAMYKTTGLIPPQVLGYKIETGSGVKHIKMCFDSPVEPYLVEMSKLPPKKKWKEYRGTVTICQEPNIKVLGEPIPIPLVVTSRIFRCSSLPGYSKMTYGYYPGIHSCALFVKTILQAYIDNTESPILNTDAITGINALNSPPGWEGWCYGRRVYEKWVVTNLGTYTPAMINGVEFALSAQAYSGWSGPPFSYSIYGAKGRYSTYGPLDVYFRRAISLTLGQSVVSNCFHSTYASPVTQPVCVDYPYRHFMGARVLPKNIYFTVGPKWCYEAWFDPPLAGKMMLCFKGPDGKMYMQFPVRRQNALWIWDRWVNKEWL